MKRFFVWVPALVDKVCRGKGFFFADYAYILTGTTGKNIGEDERGKLAWPFINHVNYQFSAMLFGSPNFVWFVILA